MSLIVSSYIPFPNIYWWLHVADADTLCLDGEEHFQKMSYRNRYYISGSNGLIQLSIPLACGRDQRNAMKKIGISGKEKWQVQHWRTIVSVYNRTPYFEYYERSLKEIFDTEFTSLSAFDLASIEWLLQQLKLKTEIVQATEYRKEYADAMDIRNAMKPGVERVAIDTAPYYQIFQDRTGFYPNLSMLDLLFAEGPHTLQWMQANRQLIIDWGDNSK